VDFQLFHQENCRKEIVRLKDELKANQLRRVLLSQPVVWLLHDYCLQIYH